MCRCAFFRRCFRDPADFTLVLAGNIDEAALVPLLEQSRPARPRAPGGTPAGVRSSRARLGNRYVASIPRPAASPPASPPGAPAGAAPRAAAPAQPLLPTSRDQAPCPPVPRARPRGRHANCARPPCPPRPAPRAPRGRGLSEAAAARAAHAGGGGVSRTPRGGALAGEHGRPALLYAGAPPALMM